MGVRPKKKLQKKNGDLEVGVVGSNRHAPPPSMFFSSSLQLKTNSPAYSLSLSLSTLSTSCPTAAAAAISPLACSCSFLDYWNLSHRQSEKGQYLSLFFIYINVSIYQKLCDIIKTKYP